MVRATIYTIGHSARSVDELLAILGRAGVQLLVDVRAFPGSRRHPQFGRKAVGEALSGAGIQYVHVAGLGGRRSPVPGSRNEGWREPGFRGYADHMRSEEFQAALGELEAAALEASVAIMCAEALWWRCHRRLIADALVVRGWKVEHLGVGERAAVHELSPFATVEADGALAYPPVQATLLDT